MLSSVSRSSKIDAASLANVQAKAAGTWHYGACANDSGQFLAFSLLLTSSGSGNAEAVLELLWLRFAPHAERLRRLAGRLAKLGLAWGPWHSEGIVHAGAIIVPVADLAQQGVFAACPERGEGSQEQMYGRMSQNELKLQSANPGRPGKGRSEQVCQSSQGIVVEILRCRTSDRFLQHNQTFCFGEAI